MGAYIFTISHISDSGRHGFNINLAFYIVLKKKIRHVRTILRHVKMVSCQLADNDMTLGRHSLFIWQPPKVYR